MKTFFLIIPIFLIVSANVNSTVRRDSISLEEMIRQSDIILIVSKIHPGTSVKNKITSWMLWKPAFKTFYDHYQVERVLYKTKTSPVPDDESDNFKVRMADYSRRLHVHKLYYNKGIRKIPSYLRYNNGIDKSKIDQFIIFCQYSGKEDIFQYTVEGACESAEKIDQIVSLTDGLN